MSWLLKCWFFLRVYLLFIQLWDLPIFWSLAVPWRSGCLTVWAPGLPWGSSRFAFNLPSIGVFPMSVLHIGCPKYWHFSFSISLSKEYSGLISFRMGWLDLLAVQGTLKSLLQHHSSEASILRHSAFFIVQLSHPYMTTGKTIALNRQTFVGKVMSLLFNKLSRLIIAFLQRSKRLLVSWLQSPSAVILEAKKIKSVPAWFLFFFNWD